MASGHIADVSDLDELLTLKRVVVEHGDGRPLFTLREFTSWVPNPMTLARPSDLRGTAAALRDVALHADDVV